MARSVLYAPEAAEDLLQLFTATLPSSPGRSGHAATSGGLRPNAKAWRSFPNGGDCVTTSGLGCALPALSGGLALLSTLPPKPSSSIACYTAAVIWNGRSAERKADGPGYSSAQRFWSDCGHLFASQPLTGHELRQRTSPVDHHRACIRQDVTTHPDQSSRSPTTPARARPPLRN